MQHTTSKSLVLGLLATVFIGGCTMHQPSYGPTQLRNKITVAETVERMELYTQASGLNLSARDHDAMGNFIAQYAQYGQGPLYLNIPSSGAHGMGVRQAQDMISQNLAGMGIAPTAVQMGRYESNPEGPAPVIVSYRRLTTAPIDCQMGASLTHTGNNQPYENFGCSQTANLAAMIDNPRQLLSPYTFDNAPSARRVTVLNKYTKGENTSSERPTGQEVSASGN